MYRTDSLPLSEDQIVKFIKDYKASPLYKLYKRNLRYFTGANPTIMDRAVPDPDAPDNKIPVSYGRKIINTVVGYMYKPGLITYTSDNTRFKDALDEVFRINREPIRSEQVGKQVSIHGVGYEYHYVDNDLVNAAAVPRFTKLPVTEVIPIYNYDVDKKLVAFIRFYENEETDTYVIQVFYDDMRREYRLPEKSDILVSTGEFPNVYGKVPLIVFENNEERIGDFDPVAPLIDSYDVLMSDSMNEFDRFAWAYLILKGFGMDKKDIKDAKVKRVFSLLGENDAMEFLTKTINSEFIKFMSEWIRGEIHRQSGIPNIDDFQWGGSASGETVSKFIYLMELFTDPKESYFKEGLLDRIDLVNRILTIRDGALGDTQEIDIVMARNKPNNDYENSQIFDNYDGRISRKTLIENFAPFVADADKEIAQLEEDQQGGLDALISGFPNPSGTGGQGATGPNGFGGAGNTGNIPPGA